MNPLEEKDSSPLEDAEITRLINVSKELGYKKQDKIPERNLVDFKPTPITKIATFSNQRDQTKAGSTADQYPEMKQQEGQSESKESLDSSFSKDISDQVSKGIKSNPHDIEEQNEIVDSSVNSSERDLDIPDESKQLNKVDPEDSIESKESKEAVNEDNSVETKPNEKANMNSDENDSTHLEEAKERRNRDREKNCSYRS